MRGSITLELLIAFGILSLSLSSAVLVLSVGSVRAIQADADALREARSLLQDADAYGYITRCMRAHTVSAQSESLLHLTPLILTAHLPDAEESRRLGGDCEPVSRQYEDLELGETVAFAGASVTALDAVGDVFYLGLRDEPFFLIYDSGWIEPEFSLPASVNDIDAIHLGEKRYVFATLATRTPGQLAVLDVTGAPELLGIYALYGVASDTTAGHGGQVHYYDGRLYVTNGYIIGAQPELHMFNAEQPEWLFEIGAGTNINTTVRDLQVRDGLLYAATAHEDKELAIFDVRNEFAVPADPIAFSDFGSDRGGDGGKSLALRGGLLYFGRASNVNGPEFYIFDITDASGALVPISSGEVPQKDVSQIIVDGDRAFLSAAFSATPSTRRIELWDIGDPTHPARIDQYPLPGMAVAGLEYVDGTLWSGMESDSVLSSFMP